MPRVTADAVDQPARLLQIGIRLGQGRLISAALIRQHFGVSKATAKRDMRVIECLPRIRIVECSGGRAGVGRIALFPKVED